MIHSVSEQTSNSSNQCYIPSQRAYFILIRARFGTKRIYTNRRDGDSREERKQEMRKGRDGRERKTRGSVVKCIFKRDQSESTSFSFFFFFSFFTFFNFGTAGAGQTNNQIQRSNYGQTRSRHQERNKKLFT